MVAGPFRDAVVAELVEALLAVDSVAAYDWARTLHDSGLREEHGELPNSRAE